MMAQNLATTQKEAKKQAGVDKDNLVLSSTAKGYSELDGVVNMVVSEATKATPAERLLLLKNEIARAITMFPPSRLPKPCSTALKPRSKRTYERPSGAKRGSLRTV
jgi:hypothetical protein